MNDRRRDLDLLSRHLDGMLDPAANAELAARLAADPALLHELVELERLDRGLGGLVGPVAPPELMVERVLADIRGDPSGRNEVIVERIRAERPAWRRRRFQPAWLGAAAALLAIAAIATLATWPAHRPVAMGTVLEVAGDVRCHAAPGSPFVPVAGMPLLAGTSLDLDPGAHLRFSLALGARIALDEGARLSLEALGPPLRLEAGRLAVEVDHQPVGHPFRIATPHGEAEAVGTGFTLTVAERTGLEVTAGTVRLRSSPGDAGLLVAAGGAAEAGPAGVLRAFPFSEGRDGYAGTRMVGINDQSAEFTSGNGRLWRPSADQPHLLAITLPGEYISHVLLRFDDLHLPPGSRVATARLRLFIDCWTKPARIEGAYLAAAWNAASADPDGLGWLNRDRGQPWRRPGAQADVLPVQGFTVGLGDNPGLKTMSLDTAVVQTWIDHPERNHGLLLCNPTADPVRIEAPQSPRAAERPCLIITCLP